MPSSPVSQVVASLRPTAVNTILAEVREAKRAGREVVSLMRGEPDLPTPAHIVAACQEALASGRTAYPNNQGEPALREAVAGKLKNQGVGDYFPEEEILITSGATFGIYAALAALLDPEDEVLVPEPIYDAYTGVIATLGGVMQSVPARLEQKRFTVNPDDVRNACGKRAKVLLLNTPWNPVGTVLTRDELSALMRAAEERDLIVISDEIYEAVVYEGHQHVSPASLSDDARSRSILVNSFSKTYAMTGWRLGYCAAPKELTRAMLLVLQQSSRGPTTFVQDAGVAALTGPQECVAVALSEYTQRRRLVNEALSDVPKIRVLQPEAGFFAMVDIAEIGLPSDEVRKRLLQEFGVVVVHGSAYGPTAEGMLRVSFAAGGQTLQEGLRRLRIGLSSIASESAGR